MKAYVFHYYLDKMQQDVRDRASCRYVSKVANIDVKNAQMVFGYFCCDRYQVRNVIFLFLILLTLLRKCRLLIVPRDRTRQQTLLRSCPLDVCSIRLSVVRYISYAYSHGSNLNQHTLDTYMDDYLILMAFPEPMFTASIMEPASNS